MGPTQILRMILTIQNMINGPRNTNRLDFFNHEINYTEVLKKSLIGKHFNNVR